MFKVVFQISKYNRVVLNINNIKHFNYKNISRFHSRFIPDILAFKMLSICNYITKIVIFCPETAFSTFISYNVIWINGGLYLILE